MALPSLENISTSNELICDASANRTLTPGIWAFRSSGINGSEVGPRAAELTVELLIYLTAFFWNLFIIVYMLVKREKLKDPPNVFLFSLSVVNFTATLLTAPFYMGTVLRGEWFFGEDDCTRQSVCKAVGFILSWLLLYQTDIIAAMAFDRFLAIAKPLHYREYLTWRRALLIVCAAFVFALIPSVTPLFGFGVFFFEGRLGACLFRWTDQTSYVVFFVILLLIPIVIITVFTVITYWKIRSFLKHRFHHHTRRYTARSDLPREQRNYNAVQRNLLWLFTALLAILAVCWFPGIATAIISVAIGTDRIPGPVFLTALLFVLTNFAANPITHAIFSKDIRGFLMKVVKFFCCCCKKKKTDSDSAPFDNTKDHNKSTDTVLEMTMSTNGGVNGTTCTDNSQTEDTLESNPTDVCCDNTSHNEGNITQSISVHFSEHSGDVSSNTKSNNASTVDISGRNNASWSPETDEGFESETKL